VDSGKIRTKEELRSLYKRFIKTYHPDSLASSSSPAKARDVDFDELKRDYAAALLRLEELRTAREGTDAFAYEAEAFMSELRDLVARGLPVSRKAVGKNKAYAASIDYVACSIAHLYGARISFEALDEQLKFLSRRVPRIYYYALQVFWSCFDCASGHAEAEVIARRHLGCIAHFLEDMDFSQLGTFLGDLIPIAAAIGAVRPERP
jgi:hypothetical protein